MASVAQRLPFERSIYELEEEMFAAEKSAKTPEEYEEVRRLRRELADEKRRVYSNLQAWETVQVARHPERPMTSDYLDLVFDDFVELHGDKTFGDDPAIRTGFAKLDEFKVLVVGHQKGKTLKERKACHFGCAHPEGYRKAMRKMQLAAKFGLPIVCLVDTPGAYPGVGAEERGVAQVIAESMHLMSRLPTPIVCIVIGEGGSGGAIGICVGDRVAMLQHAYYSVISPEGCAGILWKSAHAEQAAKALRMTGRDLLEFGVVEDVIEEPLGGAHRDHHQMAARIQVYLHRARDLTAQPIGQLLEARYARFRKLGKFLEAADAASTEEAAGDA